MKGYQRYKCQGYQCLKTTPLGLPRKRQDLSELSISTTGKIVWVTTQSIPEKLDILMVTEVEMDKMYHCRFGKLLII